MKFELDQTQEARARKFIKEHKCTMKDVGAIGGRISFKFTMTGLGTIEVVECACGESLNLTDFESW